MRGVALTEIARKLGGAVDALGNAEGFAIDSRNVKRGDVFFALKGAKKDAHDFLEEVASKGAVMAVVSQDYQGQGFGMALVPVPDVVVALQKLAKEEFENRDKIGVVGVTGSMGKTTTKEFISTILEGGFPVVKTPGNANSQVGVPLSILNSSREKALYVFEMSMSGPGHIGKLVQIAPPDIAVVTRIGLAHVEHFNTGIEGIAAAKAEILSHPQTRLAILGAQTQQFSLFKESCPFPKLIYGMGEEAAAWGATVTWCKEEGAWTVKEAGGFSPPLYLPFVESHLVENALAAVCVARAFNMSWELIAERLMLLKAYKRRFEKIERQGILFINDTYNANLDSMKAALNNLPLPRFGGKKIAVLGSMRELGVHSEYCHRELAEYALSRVDCLLCHGIETTGMVEFFHARGGQAEFYADFDALKLKVHALAQPGDVVLVKGSNSLQLWRIAEDA